MFIGNQQIDLTHTEYIVAELFFIHPKVVFSRHDILSIFRMKENLFMIEL